jgi:hypothetical protein
MATIFFQGLVERVDIGRALRRAYAMEAIGFECVCITTGSTVEYHLFPPIA